MSYHVVAEPASVHLSRADEFLDSASSIIGTSAAPSLARNWRNAALPFRPTI